jgi:hypothetical protein
MKKSFFAKPLVIAARLASILIVVGLAACAPATYEVFSTVTSSTEIPSNPVDANPTLDTPTSGEIFVPTPTGLSAGRALEAILITDPGPNAVVVSPITIEGLADPSLGDNVTISLLEYNPSGLPTSERLLARQVANINPQTGSGGTFGVDFSFPVSAQESMGWVLVSISDPTTNGLVHLTNLPLTLRASGQVEITDPVRPEEVIEIRSPQSQQIFSGSQVEVSGYSEYFFESNLGLTLCSIEPVISGPQDRLCGAASQVIASGNAMIAAPDMGQPGPFHGMIAYRIDKETPARLVVFAVSPRDGSLLHLASVEIVLKP